MFDTTLSRRKAMQLGRGNRTGAFARSTSCLRAREDHHLLEHLRHLRSRGSQRQDEEAGGLLRLPGHRPLRGGEPGPQGPDGSPPRRHEQLHQVPHRQRGRERAGHHDDVVRLLHAGDEGLPGVAHALLHGRGAGPHPRLGSDLGRLQGRFRPDLRRSRQLRRHELHLLQQGAARQGRHRSGRRLAGQPRRLRRRARGDQGERHDADRVRPERHHLAGPGLVDGAGAGRRLRRRRAGLRAAQLQRRAAARHRRRLAEAECLRAAGSRDRRKATPPSG